MFGYASCTSFLLTVSCTRRKNNDDKNSCLKNDVSTSESGKRDNGELIYAVTVLKDNKEMGQISIAEQECLDLLARSLNQGDHTRISDKIFLNDQIPLLSFIRNREIKRRDFTVGSICGKGNFGTVYRGEARGLFYRGSKTEVAMKTIQDVTNHNDTDCFLAEIKLLSNLNMHCNLVNMLGSYTSSIQETGEIWILLELCEFGDLKDFITKNKSLFIAGFEGNVDTKYLINSRSLLCWSHDIAKGMEYLSRRRVMHGDLAARNILLCHLGDHDKYMTAKVADFGLSKKLSQKNYYRKTERNYVPWKWMAYEYLEDNIFKMKSDVWSYAVVIWEMFSLGEQPYGSKDYDEVLDDLRNGEYLECPDVIERIKDWPARQFYVDIAKKCFVLEEENRISFEELVIFLSTILNEAELKSYEQMSKKYCAKYDLLLNREVRGRLSTRKGSKPKSSKREEIDRRPSSSIPSSSSSKLSSQLSSKSDTDRRSSECSPIKENEVFF